MAQKVIVNLNHGVSDERKEVLKKHVADEIGCSVRDVCVFSDGVSVSVVTVPDRVPDRASAKKD